MAIKSVIELRYLEQIRKNMERGIPLPTQLDLIRADRTLEEIIARIEEVKRSM